MIVLALVLVPMAWIPSLALDQADAARLATLARAWLPPYALSDTLYLNVEPVWAPLRYIPGKALALANGEAVVWAAFLPAESSPVEAQLYAGVGARVPGRDQVPDGMMEVGMTLNDLRGPHTNVLVRWGIGKVEEPLGRTRLTAHAQFALPGWSRLGYSSLSLIETWELPVPAGFLGVHAAYVWNGQDAGGTEQDDEWYAGARVRVPLAGQVSVCAGLSGWGTAASSRAGVTPSVIWEVFGAALMAGVSVDLSPAAVHAVHLGLHAFGEPK